MTIRPAPSAPWWWGPARMGFGLFVAGLIVAGLARGVAGIAVDAVRDAVS